jgi:hypothetical protein
MWKVVQLIMHQVSLDGGIALWKVKPSAAVARRARVRGGREGGRRK